MSDEHKPEEAAKPEKAKKEKPGKEKKSGGVVGWMLLSVPIMVGLGLFYTPLLLLVALMGPAWVALIMDSGEERAMGVCIGAGNLAGAVFIVAGLFLNPPPLATAIMQIQNVVTWFYPLSGAVVGAVIFYLVPLMVVESVFMRNQAHKKFLEESQKKLMEEWGDGVRMG